jgi:hypothetical protein
MRWLWHNRNALAGNAPVEVIRHTGEMQATGMAFPT